MESADKLTVKDVKEDLLIEISFKQSEPDSPIAIIVVAAATVVIVASVTTILVARKRRSRKQDTQGELE